MLGKTFRDLGPVNVLVLGDFMVDHYTIGKIGRISPEAPVPVMHIESESARPGGAGNVALNLAALGANVTVLGLVGEDASGNILTSALEEKGVDTAALFKTGDFPTIVKNRLIADSQHVLRLDREEVCALSASDEARVIDSLPKLISGQEIIALSDYQKGFLTDAILKALFRCAKEQGVGVIVDPKGDDFTRYRGASLIKPNQKEAYIAAKLPLTAPISEVAATIIKQADLENLVITRSEKGISLFSRDGEQYDYPVLPQEVMDVTGAGDTVLSVSAFALANGLSLSEAIQLSNIASSVAISRLGCVHVTLAEIAERLLQQDAGNKVFEEQHLLPLIEVLHSKRFALLMLGESESLTIDLLAKITRVKGQQAVDRLVLYMPEDNEAYRDVAALLASLNDVDFVITGREGLSSLCRRLSPSTVLSYQDGDIVEMPSIERVFEYLTTSN